ncbi:hypothetical protein F4820DRAFT_466837 [Hypoxylon rubiginosum]|uniref:Uncharacterized protein n=1 Tax=Hypoxylon rubiginosum TaxID=110542 RepID=A0ACB9Z8W5_9PEZI|nr:hypothetical protein F4820DRAFT_466837 [Hypoxylon rubiginosum]
MDSEHDSLAKKAPNPEVIADLVDEYQHHDRVTAPSQPVTSTGDPNVKPVGEALAVPKESSEGRPATPHKDSGQSHTTPSPFKTPPSRPFVATDSPDGSFATEYPTTPLSEPDEGLPATPHTDGNNNDTTLPLIGTPNDKGQEAELLVIVEASTLCQEDLREGLPSSFHPINRSSKITLDMSEFSDEESPVRPQKIILTKRTQSPSPSSPAPATPSEEDLLNFQREYILLNMVEKLKEAWRDVLKKCGWRLGSPRAVNTRFVPDVDHVRRVAMRPRATLQEIADVAELVMLEGWWRCCRRSIDEYRRAFRRDLVDEARQRAAVVKQTVLAEAMNARPPPPPPLATAAASSSKSKKRLASTTADILQAQERIARLSIRGSGSGSGSGGRDDGGGRYRALPTASTPTANRRQKVAYSPPRRQAGGGVRTGSPARKGKQKQQQPQQLLPGRRRKLNFFNSEVVGHIGPYAVINTPHSGPRGRQSNRATSTFEGPAMEEGDDVFSSDG